MCAHERIHVLDKREKLNLSLDYNGSYKVVSGSKESFSCLFHNHLLNPYIVYEIVLGPRDTTFPTICQLMCCKKYKHQNQRCVG